MSRPAPGAALARGTTGVRGSAGIYGMVVTGSVLAAAGGHLGTLPLAVAVFSTLVVYWLAEEYAQLGEHAGAGRLPTWARIRTDLAAKWPMVSASYLPLLGLLISRLLGAPAATAAYLALGVTVVQLTFYGWTAGRQLELRGATLAVMTVSAALLGVLMIGLKFALTHLH